MKKILIVFTNDDRLEEVLGHETDLCVGLNKEMNDVFIKILGDTSDAARLEENPIDPNLNNNENLYFVLHENAQRQFKDNFKKRYPGAKIELQSHINNAGNFYYTYLPKIASDEFNETDLEKFFQTKLEEALNTLHSSWNKIDINDKKALETLAKKRNDLLTPLI